MWIVSWDPFLMKKLLKSGICGSMNSTWCTVCCRKVNICGYCSLNSTWTVTAFCQNAWKKKKKQKQKRKTQTWIQNVDPNIHYESHGEFNPSLGWMLAVCLTHASRMKEEFTVVDGWVTRKNLPLGGNNSWKRLLLIPHRLRSKMRNPPKEGLTSN